MNNTPPLQVNGMTYTNLHSNLHQYYLQPSQPGAPHYFRQYWKGVDSQQAMIQHANLQKGESVLDIASGPGCVGLLACEQLGSARNVYFTDYSRSLLNEAIREVRRRHSDSAPSHFVPGDIRADTTINNLLKAKSGGFDVIFVHLFLGHLTAASRPTFLRHIRRLMAPNGRLVVQLEVASDSRAYGGQPDDSTILGPREIMVTPGWGQVGNWTMGTRLSTPLFTTLITGGVLSRGRNALRQVITAAGLTPGACREAHNRQGSIDRSPQIVARANANQQPPNTLPSVQEDWERRREHDTLREAGVQSPGATMFDMVLSLIIDAR